MVKSKPQDREEAQRRVSLPLGLVNHGNTCFMNSVLQGLIATRYLKNLLQFSPLPPSIQQSTSIPIASWRSPLLTNGHDLAGPYELSWNSGMPIGDVFITVMKRAWPMQQRQQRESISPKDLLTALGQKYSQYLDFRQQDAHEFLRQLLDVMRMEELDIIKTRQPPSPKVKKPYRRSTTRSPIFISSNPSPLAAVMNHSLFPPAQPDEEKLIPFVDMLFGGKLTSILVCQKCNHISHTYEDFNDLSLSIKAEDYVRERKRDKLKNLAKKFKNLHGVSLNVGVELQRSSSVPASPSANVDHAFMDEPPIAEPRRRSLNLVDVTVPADDKSEQVEHVEELDRKGEHVEFKPLMAVKKDKKAKDDDGWTRLGRRISMRVAKKPKDKDGRRSLSIDKRSDRRNSDFDLTKEKGGLLTLSSSATTMSNSTSRSGLNGDSLPSSQGQWIAPESTHKLQSASLSSVLPAPTIPTTSSRVPLISRASSPSIFGKRANSPRPPKATAEEAAYLRQILADTASASPNPFGIFKPPSSQGGLGNMSSTTTNLLLRMGQLPGIQECLRMFTAVEVLDGENMVGCRQCWKMANGIYKPKARSQDEFQGSDSDESEETAANPDVSPDRLEKVAFDLERTSSISSLSASTSSSIVSVDAESDSVYNTPPSSLSNHGTLPSQSNSAPKSPLPPPLAPNETASALDAPQLHLTTYGGMPIPMISTTAPESPLSPPTAKPVSRLPAFVNHSGLAEVLAAPLPVKDSLRAPKITRHKRLRGDADNITESADESSEDALDSDASGSILSDSSSIGSSVSPSMSVEQLSSLTDASTMPRQSSASNRTKIPRSQQVIMRPAFKRYLIAAPPPVLVIHLKRFQQLSKAPTVSFSSGFKKLEDFVAFPEYLDIGPFIAPRKEDFGLRKRSKLKISSKREGRRMYRLYAVVVHIGNMLGGHYVAYTSLSTTSSIGQSRSSDNSAPDIPTVSSEESNVSKSNNPEHNIPRKWAYISDAVVRLTTLEEVLKAKAYICMYERI